MRRRFLIKGNPMNYHNDDNAPMTDIDNFADAGNMNGAAGTPTVISLDRFSDGDYITKTGMAEVFECSDRTIQRMVERFEIPPPATVAGRKVWRAGKLKAWLAQADDRAEAEALKEVRRLKIFP